MYIQIWRYNTSCNCISLRKASNNITIIYDTTLPKVGIKIIQFSTLKNIQKLSKTCISYLSYLLELDRFTVLRSIEKLIKMNLVSHKHEQDNKNKIIQLTTVS